MDRCHKFAIVDVGTDIETVHCSIQGKHSIHSITLNWEEEDSRAQVFPHFDISETGEITQNVRHQNIFEGMDSDR